MGAVCCDVQKPPRGPGDEPPKLIQSQPILPQVQVRAPAAVAAGASPRPSSLADSSLADGGVRCLNLRSGSGEALAPTPAPAPAPARTLVAAAPLPEPPPVPSTGPVRSGSNTALDERSEGGGSSTSLGAYQGMSKEQRDSAKKIIKEFVKTMVKGRQLIVVLTSGQIRTVTVSLNRRLDSLRIRASAADSQEREIPLLELQEILVGPDLAGSEVCEGLETPLDELCVTLALTTGACITFRMPDLESRDTMAMCLTMFSSEARQKAGMGA